MSRFKDVFRAKIQEVYEPKPGDEKRFFNKHIVSTFDPQGKDSISKESPSDLIRKNVDAMDKDKSKAASYEPGQDEDVYESEARQRFYISRKTGRMIRRKVNPDTGEQDISEKLLGEQTESLVEAMRVALADSFAFYLKAHKFHWNVEGSDFPQYHEFLGKLYEEVFNATDMIAEKIRILGDYAPGSFEEFNKLATVEEEQTGQLSPVQMMRSLVLDNQIVIDSLTRAYEMAEQSKKIGVSNFLQDRVDIHEKHGWMLKSVIKQTVVSESTGLHQNEDIFKMWESMLAKHYNTMAKQDPEDGDRYRQMALKLTSRAAPAAPSNTPDPTASRFKDQRMQAMRKALEEEKGVSVEFIDEARQVVGVNMHYQHKTKPDKFSETHFTPANAEKFRKQHEKNGYKLVKKTPVYSK